MMRAQGFNYDAKATGLLRNVTAWGYLKTTLMVLKHPTTLGIRASLRHCFEEQLDWTLDDIPKDILADLARIQRS